MTVGGGAVAAALATVGTPDRSEGTEPFTEGSTPLEQIHSIGITGEDVRVGVLDPTGFDPEHPALVDAVTGLRAFDGSPVVVDDASHGTEAAATVARAAPDAALLLAAFERASGFERGLDWFREMGVDVVLAPVAAHGAAAVGDSPVNRAAEAAVEAGVTLVAPTGNAARGHWQGPLGAIASTGDSLTLLDLESRAADEPPVGSLTVWLGCRAPDPPALSLALIRRTQTGDGRQLIALSQSERPGLERLTAELEPGRYALELRLPDRSSVPEGFATAPVSMRAPGYRLSPARPAGSVAAPASAPGVVGVGSRKEGGAAAYSGRGPTPDGGFGVDLVAEPRPWPTVEDPGTSGAAAQVAGVAALVADTRGDEAARERVGGILRATATSMSDDDGPTFTTGHGVVDPLAAVRRARGTD